MAKAEIAIIGGSGVYDAEFITDAKEVNINTPYGAPSDAILVGKFGEKSIAFLPRHGKKHTIPPHLVNYRANLWALKELGVKKIIAVNACGSLQRKFKPGDLVFPDQFIDRTKSRAQTFYDGGKVCHISVADPFCEQLREVFFSGARQLKYRAHNKGNLVVVEGPRFSTRAESKSFRKSGGDIINMTTVPECVLARELQMCYATVALVTDYDVWADKPVSHEQVALTMRENVSKAKELVKKVLLEIGAEQTCVCKDALKGAIFDV